MIERDPDEGGFYVVCDFCSNDINIQQHDFMRAIESMKMRGWKIMKNPRTKEFMTVSEEWLHKCPECQKNDNKSPHFP